MIDESEYTTNPETVSNGASEAAVARAATSEPRPTTQRTLRWTLARYHEAIAQGVLGEADRVELIEGQLIEKMSIGKRHGDSVDLVNEYFTYTVGRKYRYRVQNPLIAGTGSEVEPDYAVLDREAYSKLEGNPTADVALLVIEVADNSLEQDRTVKAPLYARAGIPEYWIVNLRNDQLELHTEPNRETGDYARITRVARGGSIESPLCGKVEVAMVLPE